MAFDIYLADRVRNILLERNAPFREMKMMGGLCFMVDEKMCCGLMYSKKKEIDLFMARIGPDEHVKVLEREGCKPMDFTGRPMKNFVFVTPLGTDTDEQLAYWVDLCLAYNPLAKRSKKK
jgi:hypothetical protein